MKKSTRERERETERWEGERPLESAGSVTFSVSFFRSLAEFAQRSHV